MGKVALISDVLHTHSCGKSLQVERTADQYVHLYMYESGLRGPKGNLGTTRKEKWFPQPSRISLQLASI